MCLLSTGAPSGKSISKINIDVLHFDPIKGPQGTYNVSEVYSLDEFNVQVWLLNPHINFDISLYVLAGQSYGQMDRQTIQQITLPANLLGHKKYYMPQESITHQWFDNVVNHLLHIVLYVIRVYIIKLTL